MKPTPLARSRKPLKRSASGPQRQGRTMVCERCDREFYATLGEIKGGRRFCSRSCMGTAYQVERTCEICDGKFFSEWGPKKTCSIRCRNEARSRAKIGRQNPAYRNGGRSNATWQAAKEDWCRRCGGNRRLALHHVVYEQHVRRMGGDRWDPDNALTVCFDCHMGHHHGADGRLRLDHLRPENLKFAQSLLGAWSTDYLARYYAPSQRAPWDDPADQVDQS